MNYFINQIKLKGYKNIDKELTINFTNSTIKNPFKVKNTNVKAIFGPSGSGKSIIIESLAIYKYYVECTVPEEKLQFYRYVYQSVNQNLNEFSFEIIFTAYDDNNQVKDIIRHGFTLYKTGNLLNVSKEYLMTTVLNKSINSSFKTILETRNGLVIDSFDKQNDLYTALLSPAPNISFIKQFGRMIEGTKLSNLTKIILDFANKIIVLTNSICPSINTYVTSLGIDKISTSYLSEYEKIIKDLTLFLKVFREDLVEIKLKKTKIDDTYHIRKYIIYQNGVKIPIELESSSIKRLVGLFYPLKECFDKKIVLIDDFDLNLHPIYFENLVASLVDNINGQLIFSTSSLQVIELLKKKAYSLDFLAYDSKIYSWKKNGNTSPLHNYLNGLIPNSKFEINQEDLVKSLNSK